MEEDKFIELAKKAKYASKKIATLPVGLKNTALLNIAKNLKENQEKIFEANKRDLEEALPLVESGELKQSVFNRLKRLLIFPTLKIRLGKLCLNVNLMTG